MSPRQLSTLALLSVLGKLQRSGAHYALRMPIVAELARRRRLGMVPKDLVIH